MFGVFRSRAIAPVFLGLAAIFATPSEAAAQAVPELAAPANWTLPAKTPALKPASAPATAPASAPAPAPAPPQDSQTGLAYSPAPVPAVVPPVMPGKHLLQPPRSLDLLVATYVDYQDRDAQGECLAKAVYFEARSESLEGQLAVANVVLNRSRSGVYPSTICEVVTQPWQFSFIRKGRFPAPDRNSRAWHDATAIAAIAQKNLMQIVPANVLWYHADYVSPSWGARLTRVTQIGTHIFYS